MSPDRMRPLFHAAAEPDGGITVRFPAGTALTDAHVEAVGRHLTAGRDQVPVTLDLGAVAGLSSGALGKLLALDRAVRAAGGRLALANLTAVVSRVFKLTRLDTVLDVRDAPALSL